MKLVGYANLGARVPGVVTPIWEDELGNFLGVFGTLDGRQSERVIARIEREGVELLPEGWLDPSVSKANPVDVCMIALSPSNVIAYTISDQEKILRGLLSDPSFATELPFSRLAFAKLSGVSSLIVIEWLNTALHLLAQEAQGRVGARSRVEAWLNQEREWLRCFFENREIANDLLLDFPSSLNALGSATWFRNQLSLSAQNAPLTLSQIEDRTPSPRIAAILNLEPATPDEHTLSIMGRHLFAGTNYIFFHGPNAAAEALDELRTAALASLDRERARHKSPLSSLAPSQSGNISFFQLGGTWTGSPYVFYEDTTDGKTTVTAYRGLENCASIAKSYERLPSRFAREVLEALVAGAPTLRPLGAENTDAGVLDISVALQRRNG